MAFRRKVTPRQIRHGAKTENARLKTGGHPVTIQVSSAKAGGVNCNNNRFHTSDGADGSSR
jgi:hypothetical protein